MHIRRGTDDSGLTLDDAFPACLSSRRAGRPLFSAAAIWRWAHQISALTPLSGRSQAAPKPISGRSRGFGMARWIPQLWEVDVLDMAPPNIWLYLGLRSCGVSPVPQYPCTPRLQCRRCNHTAARHTSLHERKYLGSLLMFNAASDSRAEGMGDIDRVDLEVRFSRPRLIISYRQPLQAQQFLDYAVSRWRGFTIECRRHWVCGGPRDAATCAARRLASQNNAITA
jgi:hypothetical protein